MIEQSAPAWPRNLTDAELSAQIGDVLARLNEVNAEYQSFDYWPDDQARAYEQEIDALQADLAALLAEKHRRIEE